MAFAHDTDAALLGAAALVNTGAGPDLLTTTQQLDGFVAAQAYTGRRDGTTEELQAVRSLRDELRRFWQVGEPDALVPLVNDLLERTAARPRLVRHDGWDWHLHVTDPRAPLHERIGAEVAMALVDVVRTGELGRLRHCDARDCTAVLVDLTRNSSRRFCDNGCANRTHVAASRARKRGRGAGVSPARPAPSASA